MNGLSVAVCRSTREPSLTNKKHGCAYGCYKKKKKKLGLQYCQLQFTVIGEKNIEIVLGVRVMILLTHIVLRLAVPQLNHTAVPR